MRKFQSKGLKTRFKDTPEPAVLHRRSFLMASQAMEAPGSMSVLAMWPWTSCKQVAYSQQPMSQSKFLLCRRSLTAASGR